MITKILSLCIAILLFAACNKNTQQIDNAISHKDGAVIRMKKDVVADKIKGGWAGQVIGCTYGGPTEFKFCGTMIQDYTPIPWPKDYCKWWFTYSAGLYDDVYMDLTFVEIFEKYGLNAPIDSFSNAYAYAKYPLWHANQVGRYNILNGIKAPASGHWKNNPHADCIDFQIEADFAGLMSPGMMNTSTEICDKIGHIMNYGDGWYGGVYVAAMYSLAFVSDNIHFIVEEALKTIPAQSDFYKCINDVIQNYKKYPEDWKKNWFEVQKNWSEDIGCPDGVFVPFNIDAKVNAAYIVIGLLYGNGDFSKTIDIATRCGQDSDCNPASAGGILGTMLGYSKIPANWMDNVKQVEDMDFQYTSISLNEVYKMGLSHALKNAESHGGKIENNEILIQYQAPKAAKFEKSFENLVPLLKKDFGWKDYALKDTFSYEFDGSGIVLAGYCTNDWNEKIDYVFEIEVKIDGKLMETVKTTVYNTKRKHDLYWNYDLENKKHKLQIKLLNPTKLSDVMLRSIIVYANKSNPKI